MIRTQIQLSEGQMEALKSLAAREKVSVAELVRRAVDALFQADRAPSASERRRRALTAAGRFASGLHDVAENHDRYLAEAHDA